MIVQAHIMCVHVYELFKIFQVSDILFCLASLWKPKFNFHYITFWTKIINKNKDYITTY